jgi:type I restriction enzyme S subunit
MKLDQNNFLAELPDGWSFDRLKDVVGLRNERTDEASKVEDYIELEDLESGTGRILNRRNTMDVVSDVTLFKKGDVLFGKLRPYLEKYYEAEFDGKCTGEILAFKPEHIASTFLRYCIASPWFIERCNMLAYGAKMPRVNWPTQLAQFNLPLPPLPEQQRIAAYLDASCAAIDAAVAGKRRQIETLDALRESIIHKAVTSGLNDAVELKDSGVEWLGKLPVHWQIKRIKDIVDLKSGDAITSDSITPIGNYPVFGGNGLRGYTISYTHNGYYVLIGKQGALCGNINYAEGKFWASEHAVVAITLKKHDTFWLGELLRVMNLNQYSNAAAQPGLAVERIKFLRIPIPPYEEQIRISSWLKNTIIKNEEMVFVLRKQIATLTAYRKSLIHECVTGQRRVTEGDLRRAGRAGSIRPVEHRP